MLGWGQLIDQKLVDFSIILQLPNFAMSHNIDDFELSDQVIDE